MRRLVVLFALVVLGSAPGCGGCDGDDDQAPPDSGMPMPDGMMPPETKCADLPAAPSGGPCDVVAGGTTLLIKGNILTPETVFTGGQVAVDTTGHISCVGCDCAAGGETVVTCADGVVSPGLINTHDHITYTQNLPAHDNGVR